MPSSLSINAVVSDEDLAKVRALCNGFLDWLRQRYSKDIWMVDRYYPPDAWEKVLAELPLVHAAPGGGIWLATLDAQPVGTVMLKPLGEVGVCEMKRLFVTERARSHGVGRALCRHIVNQAIARGYRIMRFDTGAFHDEAIKLYLSMGFEFRDPYYETPADMLGLIRFFEGDLGRIAKL